MEEQPAQNQELDAIEPIQTQEGQPGLAEVRPEAAPDTPPPDDQTEFSWQASEYMHHAKQASWYVGLAVIFTALIAVLVITHQWLGIALFVVMAAAIAVYAKKEPRILDYTLTSHGLAIDQKFFPYAQFKSFTVIPDEGWHSIDLEPTKRFMPRLTVLFTNEQFDEIVDTLKRHLPEVDRHPDWVERLTRYIRF